MSDDNIEKYDDEEKAPVNVLGTQTVKVVDADDGVNRSTGFIGKARLLLGMYSTFGSKAYTKFFSSSLAMEGGSLDGSLWS